MITKIKQDKDSTSTTFFELKSKPLAKIPTPNSHNWIRSRTLDFLDCNVSRMPIIADDENENKK
jgi:hypothetical protein